MNFVTLKPHQFESWKKRCWPHIQSVIQRSHGRYNEASVLDAIRAGEFWVIVVQENGTCMATLLAQPVTWKTGLKELQVLGLSGRDSSSWLHLEREFAALAKSLNFDIVKSEARFGWTRKLKDRGWKATHAIMELVL